MPAWAIIDLKSLTLMTMWSFSSTENSLNSNVSIAIVVCKGCLRISTNAVSMKIENIDLTFYHSRIQSFPCSSSDWLAHPRSIYPAALFQVQSARQTLARFWNISTKYCLPILWQIAHAWERQIQRSTGMFWELLHRVYQVRELRQRLDGLTMSAHDLYNETTLCFAFSIIDRHITSLYSSVFFSC